MKIIKKPINLIINGFGHAKELIGRKKTYPTLWILNGIKHPNKRGHVCICGYSRHIAFIGGNPMFILKTREIKIVHGKCSVSKRCFDSECKYNETTLESYAKENRILPEEAQKMIKGWDNNTQLIKKMNQELDKFKKFKEVRKFKKSEILPLKTPWFWYE